MAFIKSKPVSRRSVLRGAIGGIGVTVGLPLLDCFLNENGSAFANGAPIPVRFGTWFWGLGMDPQFFTPKKYGDDYDLPPQIEAWKDVKQHVNLFSNYNVVTDGKPALCHYTGWVAIRTGNAPPTQGVLDFPTLDVLIADRLSTASRFRSLDATASGEVVDSFSFRSGAAINEPIVTPVAMYQKIFGSGFVDPNSPNFTPDPKIMLRKSVLSGVREESHSLMKKLGTADRARLDQYFSNVRGLEERLDVMLQKPAPAPQCKVPTGPDGGKVPAGFNVESVNVRHNLMADTMAMAIACNQTRVFNLYYSAAFAKTTTKQDARGHHTLTHEEGLDDRGVQPMSSYMVGRAMGAFRYFVRALAAMPEGDGTLLDNTIVFAHTEQEVARTHSLTGIPMMTVGRGGGLFKTGLHVDGKGGVPTTVGFTLMKALGLPMADWGQGSMKTSQVVSEILA